jgi:hypothetical protein
MLTQNQVSNRTSKTTTPFECWFGMKPDVSHFRRLGTTAYIREKRKLDKSAIQVIFVGYGNSDKVLKVYSTTRRCVDAVSDIRFDEKLPVKNIFIKEEFLSA